MNVILTHEQADFDAIGAMLGAYLMNEKAYPVLPRRLNRNVRAFLTLYGADLPFIDVRDLPNQPIDSVTLVDTQSLVTLKGMSKRTAIQVVDHHRLRNDLPENWSVTIDHVGACTTLFVEGLPEYNGELPTSYSTLLLLGIYEDTGSLTYISSKPRDVRAAAFLLEQGASLQILSRYLNPPLSDDQRQVYDRLLESAERRQIHGQNVLVAQTNAESLNEEISSIAHKLRDLMDPDALFLMVRTNEGIRLVARSVTDNIDVSKVAEHFGGGGHGRAAAALIRQTSETRATESGKKNALDEIYAELLQIIPQHVRPSLTVRQIMSPRPLVISPDTPAERAAQLMQRYGYEGYPVVEDGKVKGLLTRRSVDRALAHRMNLTASSLMESGEVTVFPNDTIEHLRKVMIDSGWGQVPVIDPQNSQVIGIVTRTDLLKTMTESAPASGRQNLAGRLKEALPPTRLALLRKVAEKAHEQHMAVYIVGGFVRDLLLGRPSPDFDVVVEGDAIALANTLTRCYSGRLVTHGRFGTAKWSIGGSGARLAEILSQEIGGEPINAHDLPENLDLISARTEFYDYPTALPTVERSSIKLDLHRRDFTINTMALRLDGRHYGELYDYWGGLRDLRSGLVRVLHSLSFVDDPTRMMRAVRFEQRHGFKIEERTLQLIGEAQQLIRQVSGDRLRHEISLIFDEERAHAMLYRLDQLNLLSAIHPVLNWSTEDAQILEKVRATSDDIDWQMPGKIGKLTLPQVLCFLAWLVKYECEDAVSIAERLRLPKNLQGVLLTVKKLEADMPSLVGARPSLVTERLDNVPPAALHLIDLLGTSEEIRLLIHTFRKKWSRIHPVTTGEVLRAMNIQPGPHYRLILAALRAARLDEEITSYEEEQALLRKLIQDLPESN